MKLRIGKKKLSLKKNNDFYLSLLFAFILFSSLFLFFFQNKELYLKKFDVNYWDKIYSVSQWATPYPEEQISDAELYAIAGSKYIRGADPNSINPGHPPLGKYLIGFSILFFNNERIMSFVIGILSLLVFFYLAKLIFKKASIAWFLVMLFSFEPLFRYQLKIPLLDLFQLFFGLLAIVFFLKAEKNYRFYFLTAIALGCVTATKTPISGAILFGIFFIYLLLRRNLKGLSFLLITFPLILITYAFTFSVHFFYNLSPGFFLRYHQWIAELRIGGNLAKGGVWRILLSGWWQTWWEGPEFIRVSSWIISWPILTLLSFLSPLVYWQKKEKGKILLIILWVLIYLFFLHFIAAFPHYLLFIFPGFYLLGFYVLQEIYFKVRYNQKRR